MKKVSVVITTKNEEKNIINCLESILNQSYKPIEIIVIDNKSSDRTKLLAKRYTKLVFDYGPECSAQRNYGMLKKATGYYVMYIDADMILSTKIIEKCIKKLNSDDSDALFIPEYILGTNFFSRVRRFERFFYDGTVIDGARFFKKNIFTKINGFDEQLFKEGSGEDWDIDMKLKANEYSISLIDNKADGQNYTPFLYNLLKSKGLLDFNFLGFFHNESNFNLKDYIKKKFYYTKGFSGYIAKWGKDDPNIRKQFGFYYRFLQVFIEKGKWKLVLKSPHYFLGVLFLRLFVGLAYLLRILLEKK